MDPPIDRNRQTIKGNRGDAARQRKTKRHLLLIAYVFFLALILEVIKHFMFPGGTRSDNSPPLRASSSLNDGTERKGTSTAASTVDITSLAIKEGRPGIEQQKPPIYSTPACIKHPSQCSGLCSVVGKFLKQRRDGVLSNPKSWLWYYQGISDYYRCVNAKKIVEVGVAFGAQTAYHLKNGPFIEEYHVVDPFLAGYDPEDPMANEFMKAAPDATPESISKAWYQSMAKDLGTDGDYLDIGMSPARCKLRMHRLKSNEGANLFGDHSIDAVFIDGLHTYDGIVEDIKAWVSKVKVGGSLIFNDYSSPDFPGVTKAVKEEAERQNLEVLHVDRTNALLGGKKECIAGNNMLPELARNGRHGIEHQKPPIYSTPACIEHPSQCSGLCSVVGKFLKQRRDGVLSNPKSWLWYYQGISDYYRCVNAKKIVEVGVAFGAQTAYHLKNGPFIEEYHVVDPFLAGYDPEDPMANEFMKAAPDATPESISKAWYQSMAKDLGTDGDYLDIGMSPARCKLRMHRLKSNEGANLFGDHSIDAVFIDGLHTYDGIVEDIKAWVSKVKVGGSLIFNDYGSPDFPGVTKAVKEEAERQNLEVLHVDKTNALLGGKKECIAGENMPHTLTSTPLLHTSKNAERVSLSPSPGCLARRHEISDFCNARQNRTECQNHLRDVPKSQPAIKVSRCKMLWFAGMSEGQHSDCRGELGDYQRFYAAALQSAHRNAAETLQPVLLLGRSGLANENLTELSALGKWAQKEYGAIVITLPRLSFQDVLDSAGVNVNLMGAFLRLDIPDVIKRHNLWSSASVGHNICPDYVLYTDSDVIFPNTISHDDVAMLRGLLPPGGDAFVSYGREFRTNEKQILNTGVMVMDVKKFAGEWPRILRYGHKRRERGDFPGHDQFWLNGYFEQNNKTRSMRRLLPIHWNWKVYWRLEPSSWTDLKVVHFHGPKPGKGLAEISECILDVNEWVNVPSHYYPHIIQEGICCDTGKTARRVSDIYRAMQNNSAVQKICT